MYLLSRPVLGEQAPELGLITELIDTVLADETIERGAQHVLLDVPPIDGTAEVIGDIPDLAL